MTTNSKKRVRFESEAELGDYNLSPTKRQKTQEEEIIEMDYATASAWSAAFGGAPIPEPPPASVVNLSESTQRELKTRVDDEDMIISTTTKEESR